MPTNFWYIIKGSWAKVSSDISTSLEMTGLQSWSIDFFLFLCSEIEEKTSASTLKTCHFKASRDITTIFGSGTLGNNINKWPKAGRHNWPPCMISDNFKIAILLYVYYMGAIETWPTLYNKQGLIFACNARADLIFEPAIQPVFSDLKLTDLTCGRPYYKRAMA